MKPSCVCANWGKLKLWVGTILASIGQVQQSFGNQA